MAYMDTARTGRPGVWKDGEGTARKNSRAIARALSKSEWHLRASSTRTLHLAKKLGQGALTFIIGIDARRVPRKGGQRNMLELQHQDHQKSLPHESIRRTHVKGGPTSLGSTCKHGWKRHAHGTHPES